MFEFSTNYLKKQIYFFDNNVDVFLFYIQKIKNEKY